MLIQLISDRGPRLAFAAPFRAQALYGPSLQPIDPDLLRQAHYDLQFVGAGLDLVQDKARRLLLEVGI